MLGVTSSHSSGMVTHHFPPPSVATAGDLESGLDSATVWRWESDFTSLQSKS